MVERGLRTSTPGNFIRRELQLAARLVFHPPVFDKLLYNFGMTTDRQQNRLAHVHLTATLMFVKHARRKNKDDVECWCAEKRKDGLWMVSRMQCYLRRSTRQYGRLGIYKRNTSL